MRHSGPLLPPTSDRNLSVSSASSAAHAAAALEDAMSWAVDEGEGGRSASVVRGLKDAHLSSAFSAQQQRAFALRTSIGSRTSDRSEPIMPRSRGNSAAELEQAGGGMPGGSQGAEHKAD